MNGRKFLFRRPKPKDDKQLLQLINSLVEEDAQILVNKRYTLKEEKIWLEDNLKRIKQDRMHLIVVEHKGEIIGSVEVSRGKWRQAHVGTLGINVKRAYRGMGLGRNLTKTAIEIAKKDERIKILQLSVYETNEIAMKLYENFGFRKTAFLPKRISYKNNYVTEIVMEYPLDKI